MNQQQRHTYLSAMGITVWQKRNKNNASRPDQEPTAYTQSAHKRAVSFKHPPTITPVKTKPATSKPTHIETKVTNTPEPKTNIDYTTLDWLSLKPTIETCQQCALEKSRNQAIVGCGNHTASLMIIGDAPADDEDRQGIPFAGKTEQLLINMLKAIDIQSQDVYMTNLIKCRPPNNRTPNKKELKQCNGFIQQQIKLIEPDLILVIGRIAAQQLLDSKRSLTQLRNAVHTLQPHAIPVIATYHPDYLLRQTSTKAKTWEDLKKVRQQLALVSNHH